MWCHSRGLTAHQLARCLPPPAQQGHIQAAHATGATYHWGQGAAIDSPRARAAYKVGAEGGLAGCQYQVGMMYCYGRGVAVDYQQAWAWLEKAAAQDHPDAINSLGVMNSEGMGVPPSWRRARELYQRAIELGCTAAVKNMQNLDQDIQQVRQLV